MQIALCADTMITVSFECPNCHIDIISPILGIDQTYAFASDLPVVVHCRACDTPSLVVHSSTAWTAVGSQCKFLDMCLKVADICRRRAIGSEIQNVQEFFTRMERDWRRTSSCNLSQEAAFVVASRIRLRSTSDPLRIA